MEKLFYISSSSLTDEQSSTLLTCEGAYSQCGIWISEYAKDFEKAYQLTEEWGVSLKVGHAYFSKKEREKSAVLVSRGGGPKTVKHDWDSLNRTYDFSRLCPKCGMDKIQIDPFYLCSEPKYNKVKVYPLDDIYDVFFAEKEWYRQYLAPLGIESRPVMIGVKTPRVSQTTVQLVIHDVESEMNMTPYEKYECNACGRIKYSPKIIDFYPVPEVVPELPIFRSKEYVLTGLLAYRRVFITQQVWQLLVSHKVLKGWYWEPTILRMP